ncbi:SusC/RagA family TonB-linked outer membrane protein, partial [Hoylesella shahii]
SVLPAQNSSSPKIVGVVTDSNTGEPLVGATIKVAGTNDGTTTDVDGRFEIRASKGATLEVSYLGYTSKKIKVTDVKVLTITLSDQAQMLEGAVITAFGTAQKKETVTGSIQTVRPTDLKVPATSLSTAFAGRLSGVIAYQRSGEPGNNGANFFVRGVSTMSKATSPLIVMDGVEISQGDLNAIDPEIIESFSVLKDATATAMYGTRGANGVLIIKTKSGADLDRPVIGVRVESWVNTPTKVPKTVDGVTFMRMYNEAVRNQMSGDLLYSDDKINGTMQGLNPYVYPNVDWYKELFKSATWNQRANFNVRGGTSKITYFMNINASHETSMLKDVSSKYFSYDNATSYMKYAFQNNVDFNISKNSKLSLHLNVQLTNMHGMLTNKNGGGVEDVFKAIMGTNPVDFPITYPKQDVKWYRWGGLLAGNYNPVNPVAEASAGYRDDFSSTVVANINYDQKLDFITKGLSFKTLFSFKNWTLNNKYRVQNYNRYQLTDYAANPSVEGGYDFTTKPIANPEKYILENHFYTKGDRRYYFQTYLDYNRAFGDHTLSGMLLFNIDEYNSNVNSDLLSSLPKRRMGLAARLSYDYKYRYMVEVNAGYNGSESFAKGHRWGFFPSISLGWNVSEEPFFEPLKNTVKQLKLRASYGLVGNDQVGAQGEELQRFAYQTIIELNNSPGFTSGYGGQSRERKGFVYKRFENNKLTWEVGRKLNVGFDLNVMDIKLTVDAFREIRSNIFQKRAAIPSYYGTAATAVYGNLAKVKNWGFDLAADYGKNITKDLSVEFRGTFTFARNKVLEYDDPVATRPALRQVGRSLNTYFGYVADGLYIDDADIANSAKSTLGNIAIAPGDVKYVDQPDQNGEYDNKIDANDRVQLGYPHVPEIIYGFGPSISYKKWDLSFFFQGQANVSLMMKDFEPFGTQSKNNVLQWIADDYWGKDNQNPNARYPRLTKYNNRNNMQESTYWLRNAAFLRLKSLEVGYKFKFGRVYASATNLANFSAFKLWDPEMGGGAGMSYPLQRTFNIGLQLTFK